MLDGKLDIKHANIRWLRSQIGHVGQTATLFHGTVRENIELGFSTEIIEDKAMVDESTKTFDKIVRAAKIANAHEFIISLPKGYDTQIGEGGAQLSGGQKQRLCIARSLVRDPKILLLDESTSNLDTKSESIVKAALQKAAKNRTTLIVAHRLGTIRHCDKIMVLYDGCVAEEGTHEQLAQNKQSIYQRLMNSQESDAPRPDKSAKYSLQPTDDNDGKNEPSKIEKEHFDSPTLDNTDNIRLTAYQASKYLYKTHAKENRLTIVGLIGAVILGVAWPLAAACISELLVLGDLRERSGKLKLWASLLVCCGIAAFVGILLQNIFLSLSAEKFTRFVKIRYFTSILSQDLSFFDRKENSVGSLVFRLNDQINQLKGLTSDLLGSAIIAVASISAGGFLACFYCWRVALVAFIFMPGIFLSGVSLPFFSLVYL